MEDEVIKVTSGLIRRMFQNVKAALGKKADTTDVVLIENIGEPMMAAPLDQFCKVPRENISENGVGILEVEKTVSGVETEEYSATVWDYIVWDSTAKKFYAFLSANDSRAIPDAAKNKYYSNWVTRSDYENDDVQYSVRQDRIFVFKQENKFKRWNGSDMQEVCLPLGEVKNTAYPGNLGASLSTSVADHELRIIRAALAHKVIKTYTYTSNVPLTSLNKYDIVYISSEAQRGYYYVASSSLMKITLSQLTYSAVFLRNPVTIGTADIAKTPFVDREGMIASIAKGETAGSYTKWYLYMKTDSENQTYTAGTSANGTYYNQPYTCYADKFNKPWELWLPNSVANRSVYIDW